MARRPVSEQRIFFRCSGESKSSIEAYVDDAFIRSRGDSKSCEWALLDLDL